jgi:hypothetical protein
MPNERIFEELLFGHKVEQGSERETNDRNIRPILVFGENDRRPLIRKSLLPLDFKVIKDGEDHLGRFFGDRVDKGVSFHKCFRYAHGACQR